MKKNKNKRNSILVVMMLFIAIASYNLCGDLLSHLFEDHHNEDPCPQESLMELENCHQITAKTLLSAKSEVLNYKISSRINIKSSYEWSLLKGYSKRIKHFESYPLPYNSNLKSVILVI